MTTRYAHQMVTEKGRGLLMSKSVDRGCPAVMRGAECGGNTLLVDLGQILFELLEIDAEKRLRHSSH